MNSNRRSLLAACIVSASLGVVAPAQDRARQIDERVHAYLEPMTAIGMFSGVVLVAEHGKILVERAYGLADHGAGVANTEATRFKLMSVSKTYTGVVAMQLVQRKAIGLGDPVGEYLPSWPDAWRAVTIHDLLDHTSGIPNLEVQWGGRSRQLRQGSTGPVELGTVWSAFAPSIDRPLEAPPGERFRYSNFNTVLAGLIVEFVSGRSYERFVLENLIAPAGLTSTGFDDGARHDGLAIGYFRDAAGEPVISAQDMSHIQPAGGYWASARDLFSFDRALCDDTLLDAEARRQLVTPKHGDYACCFFNRPVHGHACIQHSGGANGYVADFLRFVDDDAVVVVVSNFAFAPVMRISHDLAGILFGVEADAPVAVDADALATCAGTYAWGNDAYTVLRRSGQTLQSFDVRPGMDRVGGRLLLPLGPGRFKEATGDAVLQFETVAGNQRLRRDYGEGENLLPRVEPDVAAWSSIVGTWHPDSAPDDRVLFARADTGLSMKAGGLWPHTASVVPVSRDVAMALYSAGGGVLLRRDGDALVYHHYAGGRVVMRRQ